MDLVRNTLIYATCVDCFIILPTYLNLIHSRYYTKKCSKQHRFKFLLYPSCCCVVMATQMKHFVLVEFECSRRQSAFVHWSKKCAAALS